MFQVLFGEILGHIAYVDIHYEFLLNLIDLAGALDNPVCIQKLWAQASTLLGVKTHCFTISLSIVPLIAIITRNRDIQVEEQGDPG